MLKPLLKVLPTLSGNVKLVCEITKYEQIDNETFNAYVRSARLLPLSNNLIHKNCYVNLATSMFEQDMKRFYDLYINIFINIVSSIVKMTMLNLIIVIL